MLPTGSSAQQQVLLATEALPSPRFPLMMELPTASCLWLHKSTFPSTVNNDSSLESSLAFVVIHFLTSVLTLGWEKIPEQLNSLKYTLANVFLLWQSAYLLE